MLGRLLVAGALGFIAAVALPASAADQSVSFGSDFKYSPSEVHIVAGEKVTFTPGAGNDFEATPGQTHHPLDFVDASIADQTTGSSSATRTFAQPGTYAFFCRNHGTADGTGMAGRVIVDPPPAPPPSTTTAAPTTPAPQTTTTTTSTSQTTTSSQTTPSAPTTGAGTADTTAPVVALHRLKLRGLARHAAVIRFTTSEPGRASASLTARRVVLARGSKTFNKAGRRSLRLTITRSGRTLLRRTHRLRARLSITVSDVAGNRTALTRAVVVRR
jgi:plastocyanin